MARIAPEAEAERQEETSRVVYPRLLSREEKKIVADRRGSLNDTEQVRNAEILCTSEKGINYTSKWRSRNAARAHVRDGVPCLIMYIL